MYKNLFIFLALIIIIFTINSFTQENKKVILLTVRSQEALRYYEGALHAMDQGYEKEALENFKKSVEAEPEFVMALAYYSILLNNPDNQKMIDRAKKYFDEVTEGERMFTLAMEAVIKNDSAKERKILEALVAKYPDDAQVHLRLVGNYYFAKDFDKTIEEAKKLLACEQNSYSAYNSLGYAYLQIGNFDEAIKWLKKYAELMPDSANPIDSLGDAYRHAGKYKEAWECYLKSAQIKPDFTGALIHQGDVKHELGYFEEAVPFYQDALKTLLPEKEISESHYNIADAFWRVRLANNYIYLGEVDKAEKEVSTILQHNTNFGNIYGHYLAAEIALKRGDIYKAKKEAEQVQKLEKENNFFNRENDQIVNFIRAKIALVEKDLASAEKFALAAINALPEVGQSFLLISVYPLGNDRRICVEPLNLLAEIRRKQDKIDEEIQTIKKSLELISHQPKLYNRLGEIYAEQNKKEDALQAYKEFLILCEEFNCCEKCKVKAEKYIANAEGYKTILGEELLSKIKSKEHIILIDCRPPEEYNSAHIPGAVNVSMDSYGFKEDTVVKTAMEKIIKQVGKNIDFILIDAATSEEYMPKAKMVELIKYLPENRDKEVIFYCRKPT